ncbi:hypothetical protein FGO68_gene3921 [Halteria grandinella]|uniref:Uncharacterized protein n=1 Tax=Halteria grandinella TaxID=5974 RepID=A0A8J8P5E8_HALGN|nr:hypothetical protein FGO68_gene3921 [Halteria grandinella]
MDISTINFREQQGQFEKCLSRMFEVLNDQCSLDKQLCQEQLRLSNIHCTQRSTQYTESPLLSSENVEITEVRYNYSSIEKALQLELETAQSERLLTLRGSHVQSMLKQDISHSSSPLPVSNPLFSQKTLIDHYPANLPLTLPTLLSHTRSVMDRIQSTSYYLYSNQSNLSYHGIIVHEYKDCHAGQFKRYINTNLNRHPLIGKLDDMSELENFIDNLSGLSLKQKNRTQERMQKLLETKVREIPQIQVIPISEGAFITSGNFTYSQDPHQYVKRMRARCFKKLVGMAMEGNMGLYRIVEGRGEAEKCAALYYWSQYNSYDPNSKSVPSLCKSQSHSSFWLSKLEQMFHQQHNKQLILLECVLCAQLIPLTSNDIIRDKYCTHNSDTCIECSLPWITHLSEHLIILDYTYRYQLDLLMSIIQRQGYCIFCNHRFQNNPERKSTLRFHLQNGCVFTPRIGNGSVNKVKGHINSFYGPFFVTTFQQMLRIDMIQGEVERPRISLIVLNEMKEYHRRSKPDQYLKSKLKDLKIVLATRLDEQYTFEDAYIFEDTRKTEVYQELLNILKSD